MVAAVPDGAGIDPIRSERHQIAQGAILDSLDRLNVARPMTALRASRDFEIFLFGFFGRGIDNTDSHHAASWIKVLLKYAASGVWPAREECGRLEL